MTPEIEQAIYNLAELIAKQQPKGYVTEDVHFYQRLLRRATQPIIDQNIRKA